MDVHHGLESWPRIIGPSTPEKICARMMKELKEEEFSLQVKLFQNSKHNWLISQSINLRLWLQSKALVRWSPSSSSYWSPMITTRWKQFTETYMQHSFRSNHRRVITEWQSVADLQPIKASWLENNLVSLIFTAISIPARPVSSAECKPNERRLMAAHEAFGCWSRPLNWSSSNGIAWIFHKLRAAG